MARVNVVASCLRLVKDGLVRLRRSGGALILGDAPPDDRTAAPACQCRRDAVPACRRRSRTPCRNACIVQTGSIRTHCSTKMTRSCGWGLGLRFGAMIEVRTTATTGFSARCPFVVQLSGTSNSHFSSSSYDMGVYDIRVAY